MVMRQQNKGYVLLVVLIYLQLFILLNAQIMKSLALANKEATQIRSQYQLRQTAMQIMQLLDQQDPAICLYEHYSARFLQRQPLAWWREHACQGNNQRGDYYYLHEKLMKDECAVIIGHETYAARYYRTTLLYSAGWMVMVQDTRVLPDNAPVNCQHVVRSLKSGRQMLRWLR